MKKLTEEQKNELYNQYLAECEEIAQECEDEGYPSRGSNYEVRCKALWDRFYADDLEDE